MELLGVIRRWHHRDRTPIREIERRTGLSRNTIRKYLRSNAVEVRFKVPQRSSRLDPFAGRLSEWLRVEAGKGRKGRRTARQIHADLVALGYGGSYARVAAFVRRWRAGREVAQRTAGRGVFVPLAFQPGEAFQFDWSEDWATVGGRRLKLQAARTKLAHSRAFVVRDGARQRTRLAGLPASQVHPVSRGGGRLAAFEMALRAVRRRGERPKRALLRCRPRARPGRAPAVNILQAMDDPALFAPHFRGPSWAKWRAFLAALFGLPLEGPDLDAYRYHTGRTTAPTQPFKGAALIIGRRGGKSRTMALVAVYLGAFKSYSAHLAPGELATVAVIAADRRQARTVFRYIAGLIRSVPMLADMVEEETSDRIALNNGVEIEVSTASFRSTRGYTYACCICDENAYRRNEDSANPDEEIVKAIRPGLSTIPGAVLLLASSPYAQRGVLYNSFRRHHGRDHARVLVWKASTAEMNPSLDPAVIAEAYEDDPAAAAAEYGAEFRTDIASFVAREVVDACTVPGRHELPRITGKNYSAFVDPSGGSADSMTLAVAHGERDGQTMRAVLDAVREVRPPFSPEAAVDEFCSLLRSYGISSVKGDRYAGEWPREQFRKHGIAYELAERPKSDLYRDLLPLLNSGRVELLDLPKLGAQLCGLERRTARGGRDSIDHPPNGHDDLCNAAAGALLAVSGEQKPTSRDLFMAMVLSSEELRDWKAGIGPHRERERQVQARREAERNRP